MGILFTAVFTYFGFGLLLWGSLWNANLLEKLSKAKTQWNHLRGNEPAGQTMSSPIAVSDASGSVASVGSDAEFKQLISTGAMVMVQFSASWYDRLATIVCAAALVCQRSVLPAARQRGRAGQRGPA